MGIFHKASESRYTLEGIIRYCTNQAGHGDKVIYYAGYGVDLYYPVRDMLITKYLYSKTGGSDYKHFVLLMEHNPEIYLFLSAAKKIAEALYRFTGCQLIYAIHANTDKIHMHIVFNSVRYSDGSKLDITNQIDFTMITICNKILLSYGLEKVRTAEKYIQEDYGIDVDSFCNISGIIE